MKNRYVEKAKNTWLNSVKPQIDKVFGKTAVIRTGRRKITYYPAKVASVIVAVILVIVMIGSAVSAGRVRNVNVAFEFGSSYKAKNIGRYVMIYNNRGAKAIDKNGDTKWEITETLSEPFAEAEGDYVLFADLAGNHFAASYKDGKKQQEFQLGNDIISAKITKKGYAVFATDTDGYKGKVTLFNKRGREIYAWNSGSGYITDIDITDNGRYLAVAQLVTEGNTSDTKIQFIDTGRGEVVASAERKGEIAVNLKFTSSNRLLVVTDNHIVQYNRRGKEMMSISLEGKQPSLYSIDSDNMIAVSVLDNRGNSTLELYSMSGKLKGKYTETGDIRALAVCGSDAIVAEQRGLVRVNSRGKAKKVIEVEHDIGNIAYFSNGKRFLAVGTSQAEVLGAK